MCMCLIQQQIFRFALFTFVAITSIFTMGHALENSASDCIEAQAASSKSNHYCHEDTSCHPCSYEANCGCYRCCWHRNQYSGYPAYYNAYYHPDSYYYDNPIITQYYDFYEEY